jgi:hypothetical protein
MKVSNFLRSQQGSVARCARALAFLFVIFLTSPAIANAEAVILFSGTTSVQVPPGQISIALNGGPGAFSLNYFNPDYAGPLVSSFGFQSITQGIGSVSFNGTTLQYLAGSLSFTNSEITGQVRGFQTLNDAVNNNPAFTIDFSGIGFQTLAPGNRTFSVTSPTPEATSLVLLTSGVGAILAGLRKRRKKAVGDNDETCGDEI